MPIISGQITDAQTGHALPGATVLINSDGTAADDSGRYRFNVLPGVYTITVKYLGYLQTTTQTTVFENKTINIPLTPRTMDLPGTTVTASRTYKALILAGAVAGIIYLLSKIK